MSLRHTVDYVQYRGLVRTSDPATTPVTLAQVKDQLKISGTDEDDTLTLFIEAATKHIEDFVGMSLITQTWQMTLDHWPVYNEPWWDGVVQAAMNTITDRSRAANILLPRWPLVSVDTITVDGSSITITDYFIVDTTQRPGRLVLKQGATYPPIDDLTANAIVITFSTGYGADDTSIPADIKLAIRQMVAYMFEHRGDGCSAGKAFQDSGAKSMIEQYKVRGL